MPLSFSKMSYTRNTDFDTTGLGHSLTWQTLCLLSSWCNYLQSMAFSVPMRATFPVLKCVCCITCTTASTKWFGSDATEHTWEARQRLHTPVTVSPPSRQRVTQNSHASAKCKSCAEGWRYLQKKWLWWGLMTLSSAEIQPMKCF